MKPIGRFLDPLHKTKKVPAYSVSLTKRGFTQNTIDFWWAVIVVCPFMKHNWPISTTWKSEQGCKMRLWWINWFRVGLHVSYAYIVRNNMSCWISAVRCVEGLLYQLRLRQNQSDICYGLILKGLSCEDFCPNILLHQRIDLPSSRGTSVASCWKRILLCFPCVVFATLLRNTERGYRRMTINLSSQF